MDRTVVETETSNLNIEQLTEGYETLTFLEPRTDFDACIVGVVQRNGQEPAVCYAYEKVLHTLQSRDGVSGDDAEEHFSFNILGSYVGDTTPCFLFSGQ